MYRIVCLFVVFTGVSKISSMNIYVDIEEKRNISDI
jgi:hypothetical protein